MLLSQSLQSKAWLRLTPVTSRLSGPRLPPRTTALLVTMTLRIPRLPCYFWNTFPIGVLFYFHDGSNHEEPSHWKNSTRLSLSKKAPREILEFSYLTLTTSACSTSPRNDCNLISGNPLYGASVSFPMRSSLPDNPEGFVIIYCGPMYIAMLGSGSNTSCPSHCVKLFVKSGEYHMFSWNARSSTIYPKGRGISSSCSCAL